jgi:hypothetical protein
MAAWRSPGPLGRNPEVQDLNDGTLVRRLSPRPGTLGREIPNNHNHRPPAILPALRFRHLKPPGAGLQALQQGSRGPVVQKLQRLLNRRLTPSPKLEVDGLFGPRTHQAVVQYQQRVSVAPNGIVDKQTWYHLLKGDEPTVTQSMISAISAREPTPATDVWEMSLLDRFVAVLRRTGPKLPGHMRYEFEAMLTPTNLAIMAGTLVFWAASHVFGFGMFVDVGLLIGGLFSVGRDIVDAAEALGKFLIITSDADDDEDLDEGASYLTIAITIIGVAVFFAILTKIARRMGGSGASRMPEEPAPPRTPPAPRPARRELPPGNPPAKPQVPSKSKTELQLNEIYDKAPKAKAEIDAMADGIAKKTGGRVAKAPLKGRARALEKATEYYNGNASKVNDIARNTIVVERSQYNNALALLKERGAYVRQIDGASDPLGYSGANSVIRTKAGIPAEIQVNTPEMIYAKETPDIAKAILGEGKYTELASKPGMPLGGRGHKLYEEWRSLPRNDPRRKAIAAESRAYYNQVRQIGGQ